MFKKRLFWKIVIPVFSIVIILFIIGLIWFTQPLAPALALNIPTPNAEKVASTAQAAQDTNKVAQDTNCGVTGAMVFLFTSYDSSAWDEPHGADMVRYFRADYSNLSIETVALPRDLWVNTPVLSEKNISEYRFGEIFVYEPNKPLSKQIELIIHSTSDIAQTVYDNFEVSPEHYVTLDAINFAMIVDTVGGVDVNNPYALTTENYTFAQGEIHLTGAQASEFSRWLNDGETEWTRFVRQERVLLGILKKMTRPENILKLPELNEQFKDTFVTDFSPSEITSLFCLVEKVTLSKVEAHDVTPEMVTAGGPDNSFIPNVEKIKTLLKTVLFP
jgi:LCP family protein required for cell wall assembly